MLKLLRHKKIAKKIWIILAVLVLPAFVLWGAGSVIRGQKQDKYAGKIFGRNISYLEYRDAFDAVKNMALMQLGEKFYELQKYLNLESQAWERLIMLYEAKKRRIRATDDEVIKLLKSYPFFYKKGGFDQDLYNRIVTEFFRTQVRVFEEQVRQNLILVKLFNTLTSDIKLSDEEIKNAYQKENEQISIFYLTANPVDIAKDINPSEEEIKEFFTKNQLEFKEPLSFNIEYLISESEEKIKNASLRVRRKEELTKIANDMGLEVKESGLFTQIDSIPGIGWSPHIMSMIVRLKPHEFSPPLRMDKQYYLLRIKERKEPYVPDFENIKNKVKDALIKNKSLRKALEKLEECLKKGETDIDKLAKDFGLKSGSTDMFKYSGYLEGIGPTAEFWTAVNKLKDNEISKAIELPSGFYLVKLKARIPIDEKKFAGEREEFSKKLLTQKKDETFLKFAEELKRKAFSSD